ncbi:MAG: hypothetical protein ACKVW3_16815 [Phycisphaerales bacterium]
MNLFPVVPEATDCVATLRMPRQPAKPAWQDRYQPPEVRALAASMPRPQRSEFEFMRKSILALEHFEEHLTWRGVPWGWTIEFHADDTEPRASAWAYLIPNPATPWLCTPLLTDIITPLLTNKKLPRTIRDGIVLGKQVRGMTWVQWTLDCRATSEEVLAVLRRKLEAGAGSLA